MEQKWREYKKFDWTLNDKWQQYLSNLYPVPPRDLLEKKRKRWYKDNIDKDFDIAFEPKDIEDSNDQPRQQARPQQAYDAFMNQQRQQYAQANLPDVLPAFKRYQWILWVVFYVTLPLRMYTNWIALAALVVGIMKRYGMPKFNKQFLQKIMLDENLQMLPFLGVVAVGGGNSMILYMPLVLHGFLEVAPTFNQMLQRNPNTPVISIGFLKKNIT